LWTYWLRHILPFVGFFLFLCYVTGTEPAIISRSWYGKIGLVMYLVAHYYVCINVSNCMNWLHCEILIRFTASIWFLVDWAVLIDPSTRDTESWTNVNLIALLLRTTTAWEPLNGW
jgi:hypothetical protein